MAEPCKVCFRQGSCNPECPTLFWPDGKRRGDNPGIAPAESMTLQDEMTKIFSTVEVKPVKE